MRPLVVALAMAAGLTSFGGAGEAMPAQPSVGQKPAPVLMLVADACGPGLVRGRRGTCLVRRAVFSHGRIVRKGCGKPIGATGQRTPC